MFKRIGLVVLAALWLGACATQGQTGQDPVIGKWKSVGAPFLVEWEFKADHTGRRSIGDDHNDCTWAGGNGVYDITEEGHTSKGAVKIDAEGRLSFSPDGAGSEFVVAFEKVGGPPPGSKPKPPAGPAPTGEWHYAYTSKSNVPAAMPPPFDIMNFLEGGKVKLKSTMNGKDFEKSFSVAGGIIKIVTGEKTMPSMEFGYRWEADGARLILFASETQPQMFRSEWTMLRPDKFCPDKLEGVWARALKSSTEEMEFRSDGTVSVRNIAGDGKVTEAMSPKFHPYFRLWPAPFGNAMTAVTFNREMGMQESALMKFVHTDNRLEMMPVEVREDGTFVPHEEHKLEWTLKK